ncbi:hypothetical protein XENOCAPTIV_012989 [Xenoophorus captivus]|uniref:Uncharacterized protein n=1 Tax=Xenoophorus captivus TaxID=1517983 RepID=A0ABV0RMF6_9TELE
MAAKAGSIFTDPCFHCSITYPDPNRSLSVDGPENRSRQPASETAVTRLLQILTRFTRGRTVFKHKPQHLVVWFLFQLSGFPLMAPDNGLDLDLTRSVLLTLINGTRQHAVGSYFEGLT